MVYWRQLETLKVYNMMKKVVTLLTGFLLSTLVMANPKPIIPAPPEVGAKAYMLMDVASGKVLTSKNEHERLAPASLTKMMTVYVAYQEIKQNKLHLTDMVHISENAWRTEGSKMFVEVGKEVSVDDLLHGIIIQSGNDASVALAEHIAGSETAFADLMNGYAKKLGMNDSHFVNSTGMPDSNHYTSAADLALLARATIQEFPPELYALHSEKWFTFNGIKQPNRNQLLWRNPAIDGLKTGHHEEAGYCLAASAKKDHTRLVSVILGAESTSARAEQSNRLITYGLRFFETHQVFAANKVLNTPRVWMGNQKTLEVGLESPLMVTVPQGQYPELQAKMQLDKNLHAPIKAGQVIGSVVVRLGEDVVAERPLVALKDIHTGGLWSRFTDYVSMHSSRLMSRES